MHILIAIIPVFLLQEHTTGFSSSLTGLHAVAGHGTQVQEDGSWENKAMFGVVGQFGLEFQFWFPLQISADVRPILGYSDGEFWNDVFDAGNIFFPVLSIRYLF